jgi:hypothetical protein
MTAELASFLALANDVLQAAIVIFGVAVTLYNLPHSFRDRVTRAFNSLLFFVAIVFLAELLATRTTFEESTELWIRLQWIGVAMVPAAQFHLADALLTSTGDVSRARRLFVRVWYLTGVFFFSQALLSDLLVVDLVPVSRAPHLSPGPFFPVFTIYYWAIAATSVVLVWRARQRCLTTTTRRRMTMILTAFMAAPLSVFPYLMLSGQRVRELPAAFWLLVIGGNLLVGVMFAFLTYTIAYFGATSPDRVVRVRLFKFMARVPLAATVVLLVFVAVTEAGDILGLRLETALAITIVGTLILVEWAVHAFKRPLERLFQLTDEPEVRRIQELGERLLTTRDLHQFLESILAATCEVLRTPTAFVAAFAAEGPSLEVVVGPLNITPDGGVQQEWRALADTAGGGDNGAARLHSSEGFFIWRDFWIWPLYSQRNASLLGILGVHARAVQPDLSEGEGETFEHLAALAADALEDRLLQQEVFAAVEGLLPEVTAIQLRRSAATFGGAPVLAAPFDPAGSPLASPNLSNQVWDALSHYWGGPKLTESPLMQLRVVRQELERHDGNPTRALREILGRAVEQQRPEGERSMTTGEWILYNILELKFIQGHRVRDVARRLAMSESDLYRKQRVAIENVARTIMLMEEAVAADLQPEPEANS